MNCLARCLGRLCFSHVVQTISAWLEYTEPGQAGPEQQLIVLFVLASWCDLNRDR